VFSFQPDDTVAIRPIRKVAKRGVKNLSTLATWPGAIKNAVPPASSRPNVRITKTLKWG
jgi:hypothetical protein